LLKRATFNLKRTFCLFFLKAKRTPPSFHFGGQAKTFIYILLVAPALSERSESKGLVAPPASAKAGQTPGTIDMSFIRKVRTLF
jgi:hypothetical protein